MNVNELKSRKFLKRQDVGPGVLVTIKSVVQENVAKEGAPEELRWCMHFEESINGDSKPCVLNSTNGQIIAGITKSEESDSWIGAKIVLYDDPNVSFGGKLVGGIRVRAPRLKTKPPVTAQKPATAPAPTDPTDDNGEPLDGAEPLPF